MAMQSMPTVSYVSSSSAMSSLLPTPSVVIAIPRFRACSRMTLAKYPSGRTGLASGCKSNVRSTQVRSRDKPASAGVLSIPAAA